MKKKEIIIIEDLKDSMGECNEGLEIKFEGYNVTVREDLNNYYIDFRTGLGEGIYPKKDWTLFKALYDQAHIS